MADSPGGTDSIGEPTDDGQLTIRIPNPKVYMARQSQWKGRRGKPRCDHCRMNNLKCDRVLPTCNHCSWANGRECKYTPLPTPAHRGIPRCDRCRQKNLKCDRSLPVCNNCHDEQENDCNYTPKKRHKVPSEHGLARDRQMASYGAKTASFLVSDMPSMEDQVIINGSDIAESSGGHTFYGHNVASSSRPYGLPHSPKGHDRDGSSDSDSPGNSKPSQYSSDHNALMWTSRSSLPHLASKPAQHLSFISHSFPSEQGTIISKSHVLPWSHPSFAPLPETVLRRISAVNPVEMPNRSAFDDSLAIFLARLIPELRETAAFMPDAYANVARCVSKGDISDLSERLRLWTSCHHLRSGSNKFHLLILPRDPFFQLDRTEEERLRMSYVTRTDGSANAGDKASVATMEHDLDSPEWTTAFERVPAQNQIYDILVYAHRAHGSSSVMLFEIRRIGIATITWPMVETFIQLCPLCSLRRIADGDNSHPVKTEASASLDSFDLPGTDR